MTYNLIKRDLFETILLLLSIICVICISCSENDEVSQNPSSTSNDTPSLLKLQFSSVDNPSCLIEDVIGNVVGDSIVECWIPYIVQDKKLFVKIDAVGGAFLDGNAYDMHVKYDFSKPVELSVVNQNAKKTYNIYVHSYTGLPIVWIETDGRQEIVSKVDYLKASFRLEQGVFTRSAGELVVDSVLIRGRGSSSWTESPKKSYRLKFERKISLLDEPKDKSWVMVANYFDKTMLRNQVAYFMGKLSNLDYTPGFHFVELFFNGQYDGTYMLGDKLKISKDRVNVGDDGFLLEVDERAIRENDVYFRTKRLKQPVSIKDPDVELGDDNYTYICDYLNHVEDVLFSDFFKDRNEGWQKYMDITSFVDWFVIHEIAKCGDPLCFYTSCYMNLRRGDKLKMGPIWDFDLTMGNSSNPNVWPVEGMTIDMGSPWYERLFQDQYFVSKVKERFKYFYSQKERIMNDINANAHYLRYSVVENNNRWGNLYMLTFAGHDVLGNYYNEVQYLKNWLTQRFEWLRNEFDKM